MRKNKLANQAASFLAVGIISTALDWMVFAFLFKLLHIVYWAALIPAFITGALINYLFNKEITFNDKSKNPLQPVVFFIIASLTLTASLFLMSYFIKLMDGIFARMLTTLIIFVANFILHKTITFGKIFKVKHINKVG
jgi:putative flippase GtrA